MNKAPSMKLRKPQDAFHKDRPGSEADLVVDGVDVTEVQVRNGMTRLGLRLDRDMLA